MISETAKAILGNGYVYIILIFSFLILVELSDIVMTWKSTVQSNTFKLSNILLSIFKTIIDMIKILIIALMLFLILH